MSSYGLPATAPKELGAEELLADAVSLDQEHRNGEFVLPPVHELRTPVIGHSPVPGTMHAALPVSAASLPVMMSKMLLRGLDISGFQKLRERGKLSGCQKHVHVPAVLSENPESLTGPFWEFAEIVRYGPELFSEAA